MSDFKIGDAVKYNINLQEVKEMGLAWVNEPRFIRTIRENGLIDVECEKGQLMATVRAHWITRLDAPEKPDKYDIGKMEGWAITNEDDEPIQTPGYLDCQDGKTQLHWPSVKPQLLAGNKGIPPSDTAANSCSHAQGFQRSVQAKIEMLVIQRFFSELNNKDRKAMIPELQGVIKLATELLGKIKESV